MSKEKPSYKEIHGTTRVGDFLRSINKSEVLTKVLGVGTELITGDVAGAVEELLRGSDELTTAQREYALKLLESDVKESAEISNRWKYDMESDSWLSKNVRPILLAFLTFSTVLLIFLDSSVNGFLVAVTWVDLLQTLLLTVFVAYFGGRSYEKIKKR